MLIGINLIQNNSVQKIHKNIRQRYSFYLFNHQHHTPPPTMGLFYTCLFIIKSHIYSYQLNSVGVHTTYFSVKIKAITKEYTPSHSHTFLLTGIQ